MNYKKRIGVLVAFLLLILILPTVVVADEEITYRLSEDKTMHQFIISGDENDFEVNMILPDGTTVDHEEFDPDQFMYFSMENQRVWAVKDAKEGTYTFEVQASSDESFSVRAKDSVERPTIEWKQPSDEEVSLKSGELLELEWEASGEFSPSSRNMKVLLKSSGGHMFEVGTATISNEAYELEVPQTIPPGDYELHLELEDEFSSDEFIDPKVTISYENSEYEMEAIHMVEQEIRDGALYVIVDIPKYNSFNQLRAIVTEQEEGIETESTVDINELLVVEELDDSVHYLWEVMEFTENGNYKGAIIAMQREDVFSPSVEIDPFQISLTDFSEDQIEWSLEEGLTNASSVTITTNSEAGTVLTVMDEGQTLLQEEISEEGEAFSVPLQEGYRVIEVELSDENNNSHAFNRMFQVDHTPPTLEMIQPLPAHQQLEQAIASGHVEAESTLVINGEEVTYDEDGYFRVDNFGNKLTIAATDASGNETLYTWQPITEESSQGWIWPVLIVLGILGSTGGFIFYLRKTKG